jgi:acyl-CoA synthetase (AMP-forming)/AMP-acid ligase II
MGNVPELIILILACSKLGAVAMPVDATMGDRSLREASARRPLQAMLRRPRGPETPPPDYAHHEIRGRKKLSGTLLAIDLLTPGDHPGTPLPDGTELVREVQGIGGVLRDQALGAADLTRLMDASRTALGLDDGPRVLCSHPLTVSAFFDAVLPGWLASDAQLVLAETAELQTALAGAGGSGPMVVVDTLRGLGNLARSMKGVGPNPDLRPVALDARLPKGVHRILADVSPHPTVQVLQLDELGPLASRPAGQKTFDPLPDVELAAGASMDVGGHELLVRLPRTPVVIPALPDDDPATPADDDGYLHTGFAARFDRQGAFTEILGRDDGLVWLEGRRACLDAIEETMLAHRRVTWARADVKDDAHGAPEVILEYCATGDTAVEDIEEHAIASLAPFMVPRGFTRRETPPPV